MGSLYAAISGLQASSRWLDVISNNVSNSQTVGFKTGRVSFEDLVSQGLGSASGASQDSNLGGIDPVQLGLGVTVSSVQNLFTQGGIQTTGNATDLAIQGTGMFTVKEGSSTLYTRAGNFTFDNSGNLVTANGGLVQGWSTQFVRTNDAVTTRIDAATYKLDTSDTSKIGNITIPANLTIAPKATSANLATANQTQGVIMAGNLDAKTTPNVAAAAALRAAGFIAGGAGLVIPAYANHGAVATIAAVNGGGVGPAMVPDPFNALTPDATSTAVVYDSVGTVHSVTTWYFQVGDTTNNLPPQWAWYSFDTTVVQGSAQFNGTPSAANCIGGSGINNAAEFNPGPPPDPLTPTSAYGLISFNADGSMCTNGGCDNALNSAQFNPVLTINNPLGSAFGTDPAALNDAALDPFNFSVNFGTGNTFANAGDSNSNTAAVNPFNAPIVAGGNGNRNGLTGDFGNGTTTTVGGIPTYIPNSNAHVASQDGYSEGLLESVAVDQTGKINCTFSNSQTIAVAQLALASFNNPSGLNKAGDNNFTVTANSGIAVYSTAGANGTGTITGGALEQSNVDLTVELTNMIVAQHMFEANSRVITTASLILDNLVQMGR